MPRSLSIDFVCGSTLCCVMLLAGCDRGKPPVRSEMPSPQSAPSSKPVAVHEHGEQGPHHGDLIELGNEEYHAEIVHGDGGGITVYLLDSQAAKAVPIDASDVVINLNHDGNAEQFRLPAAADEGDPAGQSSRFALKNEELADDLDSEKTTARLVVKIGGTSYTGKIEHHHAGGSHHEHRKR